MAGGALVGGTRRGRAGGFLFRLAKMGQDPVDDLLVLNTSDDSDRASTASTDLDVDIEYSLESSCSDDCCVTLCLCPRLGIGDLIQRLTISGRCDSPMPA